MADEIKNQGQGETKASEPKVFEPLDAEGLKKLGEKTGLVLTLENRPATPDAHHWVREEQKKLHPKEANRLWNMIVRRAANDKQQLTLEKVKRVNEARKTTKENWIGLEPDASAKSRAEPCFNCEQEFEPMLVNVRRKGEILKTDGGAPIKSGNYIVLRIDGNGDVSEQGTPTPVGICKTCKRLPAFYGMEFYSYARVAELTEKARRGDDLSAKAGKIRSMAIDRRDIAGRRTAHDDVDATARRLERERSNRGGFGDRRR